MKFIIKNLKWIFVALCVAFAALQFTTPAHTNPPVQTDFLAATAAPPKIAAMFRSACYDCHSNETRWPWYSHIAPISWQIAGDVNDGRNEVNLSEWPANNLQRCWKRMENMSDEIDNKEMPLPKYTLIHKDARLTDAQRDELTQWLGDKVDSLKAQAGK